MLGDRALGRASRAGRALRQAAIVAGIGLLAAGAPVVWAAPPTPRLAKAVQTAKDAFRAERYADVVKALRPALDDPAAQTDPIAGDAWRLLGHAYLRRKEHAEARQAFAHALARGAMRSDALRGLARITAREGEPGAAAALLRLAIALEPVSAPDRAETQLELADLLARAGQPTAAAAALEAAARERPADPRVAAAQGWRALEAGRADDAILFLETAASLGDARPDVSRALARLYRERGDALQQARWAERLLAAPAPRPEDHLLAAEALADLGAFPRALREAQRALDAGAGAAEAAQTAHVARRAGHVRLTAGDRAGAAAAWRLAAEAGDGDPELARFIGVHALETGDRSEAIGWLQRWRAAGGREPGTLRALAAALLDEGKAGAAKGVLVDYVAAHGVDDALKPLLDRLAASP